MGNTIRCCIACILPCTTLDVVHIVHSDGRVEELSGTVHAADVIKAHPKHVLKKPSSRAPRILAVPPDAVLRRGRIYFLIPAAAKRRKRDAFPPSGVGSQRNALTVDPDRYLSELLREKVSPPRDRRRRVAVWRPRLERISEATSAGENSGDL